MNTQSELAAATKIKPKRGEDEDDFRQRLVEAVSDLDDKAYAKLSKGTKAWADSAIETYNDTGKVPVFEDADEDEDEDDEEEEEVVETKSKKKKLTSKKKAAPVEDEDVEEDEEEDGDVKEDDDGESETEEDEDMQTQTETSGGRRSVKKKGAAKKAAASANGSGKKVGKKSAKKVAPAGRKTDDKGASGQMALRRLLVRDPNLTNDELTTRLEKSGYELSSITISSQRSQFRNIVKVLQDAGLMKKNLIT